MPYYRRKFTKSSRRYRRKGSKFSRFNTYKNRSSKAQAYQIYALNRKVNRVVRANKPETQIAQGNCITDSKATSYTTVVNQSTDAIMWNVIPPSKFTTFQGKLCRIKDVKIYGTFTSEYALVYPAKLRLIFFQAKKDITGYPLPSQIVNYAAGNNTDYERGPLKTGITANYKILGMRTLTLSLPQNRTRTFKYKLTKLYNFRSETAFTSITVAQNTDEQIFPRGSLFCLALFSNSGFKQSSESSYPALTLKNFDFKISYVDQN